MHRRSRPISVLCSSTSFYKWEKETIAMVVYQNSNRIIYRTIQNIAHSVWTKARNREWCDWSQTTIQHSHSKYCSVEGIITPRRFIYANDSIGMHMPRVTQNAVNKLFRAIYKNEKYAAQSPHFQDIWQVNNILIGCCFELMRNKVKKKCSWKMFISVFRAALRQSSDFVNKGSLGSKLQIEFARPIPMICLTQNSTKKLI